MASLIRYAPRGHAAPPKDPAHHSAIAAVSIQSSPITGAVVSTPVVVRSDARSSMSAMMSARLTHRVGTVSGAVVSAISRLRRVTGVATRRTLWSSGPRWGSVTGPEGASAAGGHADDHDTGLSGDPVEVLVEVLAEGDREPSHEPPTVRDQSIRGRAEDRAGIACKVECECHVMRRETGPAVRLLVRVNLVPR